MVKPVGHLKLKMSLTNVQAPTSLHTGTAVSPTNLVTYRLPHEKKITGLPQIYILTHSLRDLTSPSFCLQAEYAAHQGRREQVRMHGISMVLKLVSIEYQKRDAFLAALQLGGNRLTFQSSLQQH